RQLTRIVWGARVRLTMTKPETKHFFHVQAQGVGIYSNDGQDNEHPNDKGLAVGAAYDYSFHGPRPTTPPGTTPYPATHVYGLGFRGQAERVFNGGNRGSVWRFSVGLIYRSPRMER